MLCPIAIHKQPFAGDFVSNQALLYLREMGITVTPQYLVAKKSAVDAGQPAQFEMRDRPNTTESYHRLAVEVSCSSQLFVTCASALRSG